MAKILIADDEALLLESLAKAARKDGHQVETAADGEDAWKLLQASRFDLVVTDLRMPNLDGHAVMARIASLHPTPLIIAITGYASLEAAVDCLRKGAADFLVKPFEVEDFLEALNRVLSCRPTAHPDPDWQEVASRYDLTGRQLEVLQAFYRTGKSNKELADNLFLSQHTVKSHIKAAFDKMGVSNRVQLLKVLREQTR